MPQHYDPVSKPAHYNQHPSGIETIQVTEHMNFCLGNAMKYLWRREIKHADPVLDFEKSLWYINREIHRRFSNALESVSTRPSLRSERRGTCSQEGQNSSTQSLCESEKLLSYNRFFDADRPCGKVCASDDIGNFCGTMPPRDAGFPSGRESAEQLFGKPEVRIRKGEYGAQSNAQDGLHRESQSGSEVNLGGGFSNTGINRDGSCFGVPLSDFEGLYWKDSQGRSVGVLDIVASETFYIGQAMLHIWRADLKNGLEDLEKAAWYIQREIERRKKLAAQGLNP